MLHKLKVDNGIFLDELRLRGILAYSVAQAEGEDTARLMIDMDVSVLGNITGANFNSLLNEDSDGAKRDG